MRRFSILTVFAVILGLCVSSLGYAQANSKRRAPMPGVEDEMEPEETTRGVVSKPNVKFSLKGNRDPMLSAEDVMVLQHREKMRLAAEAAERKRQEEEERKRREEEERRREWERMIIRDPTILVRNQIKISGLIDKEVLIGGKLYTIGNTYKGAKIVAVGSDSVTFSYKGHKFVKKVSL